MTRCDISGLITALDNRRARFGMGTPYLTDGQQRIIDSPYKVTVVTGANGVGKTWGGAYWLSLALQAKLPWQTPGERYDAIIASETYGQLAVLLGYLWDTPARSWFKEGLELSAGEIKGQRTKIYDLDVPGVGLVQLRCGTFKARNLAGPRSSLLLTNEPVPPPSWDELITRLLGRNGRAVMDFTPTMGTAHMMDHIWELVDDPAVDYVGEVRIPLTVENVTPRGGLVEVPWISEVEIRQTERLITPDQREMRMGRSRKPVRQDVYFDRWSYERHVAAYTDPPGDCLLGVGVDHGSKPGAQRGVLVAVQGQLPFARVWVLDEYKPHGSSNMKGDAKGLTDMLHRQGYTWASVDFIQGDRAHDPGKYTGMGGRKSNDHLKREIARLLGIDTNRSRWSHKLPPCFRNMNTPTKFRDSDYEGMQVIHGWMVEDPPQLLVSPVCKHLIRDISTWQGGRREPQKDGLDAFRYAAVSMARPTNQ